MTPEDAKLRKEPTAARSLAAGQILIGMGLSVWPRWVSRVAGGRTGAAPAPWIVRFLGVRLLGQGAALLARPTPGTEAASSAIDAAHAASMVALAIASGRYRRAALVSAAAATVSAAAAAALAVTGHQQA